VHCQHNTGSLETGHPGSISIPNEDPASLIKAQQGLGMFAGEKKKERKKKKPVDLGSVEMRSGPRSEGENGLRGEESSDEG
jgi:hypothetical protein